MALKPVSDPSILAQLSGDEGAPQSIYDRNQAYARPAPNGYQSHLQPAEESGFQAWVKKNNVPFDPSSTADYDMRGFYKGVMSKDPRAQAAVNPNDKKLHFPDYWKTPYHKSFSAESQWATKDAPNWNDKDQLVLPSGAVVFDERAKAGRKPVTDPALLAQLEGTAPHTDPRAMVGNAITGAGEMALKIGTGGLAAIPAGLAYGGASLAKAAGANVDPAELQRSVQEYWTYEPVSNAEREGEAAVARVAAPIVKPIVEGYRRGTEAVGRVMPFAGQLMKEAPSALQAAAAIVPAAAGVRSAATAAASPYKPPPLRMSAAKAGPTAEDVVSRLDTQQSMGAAASAPSLQAVSPELREAIVKTAQKTGGAVNPQVLGRHIEADTLPVRMRLTEGQATQDPVLISQEMNLRGSNKELAEHFNEQARQLAENARAIRDEAGPDVFSTNAAEHGDTLIAAYKTRNEAAQTGITAKYQALLNANGGNFPIDGKALLKNAEARLHKKLLFDHAPKSIMTTLKRLSSEGMTFENFESLRTNLARIQRSPTADGNEQAAAGVIREAMEELPLSAQTAKLKPLADDARVAARAQFRALEADPAYKAAVNDELAPERFVQRYVLGASRDQAGLMRRNLADDDTALQTMGVIAMDHLRSAARLDPSYQGNFAAASFNKALITLSPKLRSLLPPRAAEQLEQLGNVSRYTTAQPRGSYVNNSNTFVAQAADKAASAAEGIANVAAGGVPVGTWTRRAIEKSRERKRTGRSLSAGSGLDRLPERRQ